MMENIRSERPIGLPIVGAMNYLNILAERFWQMQGQLPRQLQSYLNFLLCEIDPLLSHQRMAAEVVGIESKTSESKTITLRPPARWKGFEAGQFIGVEIEIDGVRLRRNYSLSCSPNEFKENGTISFTVKQVEKGRVSECLNRSVNMADILHISHAMGQFTLPSTQILQSELPVFVAAGSGITPIKSMIDQLVHSGYFNESELAENEPGTIVLIHHSKNPQDIIFQSHFERLAKRYPSFIYIKHFSDQEGVISFEQFRADCPDLSKRAVYVCGPAGFMEKVSEFADALSLPKEKFYSESFGQPPSVSAMHQGESGMVEFVFAQRQVMYDGNTSLLELAEAAGLNPKYGCRSGVCHECKCQRPKGPLVNRLTGQTIPEDQLSIQSCISVPVGNLVLNQW